MSFPPVKVGTQVILSHHYLHNMILTNGYVLSSGKGSTQVQQVVLSQHYLHSMILISLQFITYFIPCKTSSIRARPILSIISMNLTHSSHSSNPTSLSLSTSLPHSIHRYIVIVKSSRFIDYEDIHEYTGTHPLQSIRYVNSK